MSGPEQRLDRVRLLTSDGRPGELRPFLNDPNSRVRREALHGLVDAGVPGALELLVQSLADGGRRVRRYAAHALRCRAGEAVPALVAGLSEPERAAWCAAVLAGSTPGRLALREQPDGGLGALAAASRAGDLPVRLLVGVTKCLAICPGAAADVALIHLSEHRSELLRQAALRTLLARREHRGTVARMIERFEQRPEPAVCRWLADAGDPAALPALHRLLAVPRVWGVALPTREAARAAIERIEALLGDISDAAISHAPAPSEQPGEAALSLWSELETPAEAASEDE